MNFTTSEGETLLMLAARSGQEEIVRFLVREGADTTVRNSYGLTAAAIAKKYGRSDIASYLR